MRKLVESSSADLSNQSSQSNDHMLQWSNQLQTDLGNRVEDINAFLQEKMKKDIPTGKPKYFQQHLGGMGPGPFGLGILQHLTKILEKLYYQ